MKIVIVGTGYVGLISGVCLAKKGHNVVCVDSNKDIVASLNRAVPTIHEKGLPALLKEVIDSGNFSCTNDMETALCDSEVVIIAVGTPSNNGEIDLSYVLTAVRQIGAFIKASNKYLSVIVKSTVLPGTTDTLVRNELELSSGKKFPEFGLGMNPEFLREGDAVSDFMFPDRIVLGADDDKSLNILKQIYSPWSVDLISCNTRTAEMTKYANNCMLATQISAVNELANYAAKAGGIDISKVFSGVHMDKRWNPILPDGRCNPEILDYLLPGCGFGGSCFPKDVQALRAQGNSLGLNMSVLDAVLDVNERQPSQVKSILLDKFGSLRGKRILLLGLSFKPGTDDVRESASLKIASDLLTQDAIVFAHDPIATENFKKSLGDLAENIDFIDDWISYIDKSEIILVATNWDEYKKISTIGVSEKVIFDTRRLLDRDWINCKEYLSIGLS